MPDALPTTDTLENEQPWNRCPGENELWYNRFLLFRDLGPSRKVQTTYKLDYRRTHKGQEVPCISKSWYEAARRFDWVKRANAYDEHRRKEVFTEGYAYDLTRINRLDRIIEMLEERIIKGFQNAKDPKGVSFELLDLYLKALDGMAKETGGRVAKKEVTGANGAALEVLLFLPEQEEDDS